ncbi:L-lactate permease [Alicyclobacillus mali (ex Roth et al. 2021)]|uniref:L-lactate permease n=1 Tax=Alicyclobacillus mali (ex Roth et al. 2021) TaxID=1123961 RepID=UPI001F5D8BD7|nr:L-lactate permease [Alicyclobacillus mali (ex Roth et al. 2021)]
MEVKFLHPGLLSLVFSCLPVFVALLVTYVLRWSSFRAGLIACAAAGIIASFHVVNQTSNISMLDTMIRGALESIPVAEVLLFGLLFYHVLLDAGSFETIQRLLLGRITSPGRQTLLVVSAVGPFFEATTGFGLGIVLSAALLSAMQWLPRRRIAQISLLTQSQVPWGAFAAGTWINSTLSGVPLRTLAFCSAALSIPLLLLYGAIALYLCVGRSGFRQHATDLWVACLVEAACLIGFNDILPPTIAGAVSSAATTLILRLAWNKSTPIGPGGSERGQVAEWRAWARSMTPYALVFFTCFTTSAMPSVTKMLNRWTTWTLPSYDISLSVVENPGMALLLGCFACWLLFRVPAKRLRHIADRWLRQAYGVIGSTVCFFILAALMRDTGMTRVIADGVAGAGRTYIACVPFLGGLGGYLTGSNSAANAMFASFQAQAARAIGLPVALAASIQNVAASSATMASPSRVTMAGSSCGLSEAESSQVSRWTTAVMAVTLAIIAAEGTFGALMLASPRL